MKRQLAPECGNTMQILEGVEQPIFLPTFHAAISPAADRPRCSNRPVRHQLERRLRIQQLPKLAVRL
jgi:hypothetical protein